MTLATNVTDLATRIGTEAKALRSMLNGNVADLSGLSTQDKSSLLAAVNEIAAAVATAAGIDDSAPSTGTTYSSTKTLDEIAAASTADRARGNHSGTQSADTLTDGTSNKVYSAAEKTKLAGVAAGATANATDANLRDRSTHTGTQPSSSIANFAADVDARVQLVVDAAPAALDTLNELAAAIGDDANFAANVTAGLANRVRWDASQTLTGPQQAQARSNIGAASAVDVGDTSTNYVTAFNAALV